MNNFAPKDQDFLNAKGITTDYINWQLDKFEKGFPWINLDKEASINNGIISFDTHLASQFVSNYDDITKDKTKIKFVPASGAATRMFKDLYYFADNYKQDSNNSKLNEGKKFLENIETFAFFGQLQEIILQKHNVTISKENALQYYKEIIECLLSKEGLNYGNLPKAMIDFHRYANITRKAIEEHIVEGVHYASNKNTVNIHFTVSIEHLEIIKNFIKTIISQYEKEYGVSIAIYYSNQKKSTDTIAIDNNNQIVREKNGDIHLRPSGHGALIENLNELDYDIIFVKNIDNIVPDRLKPETIFYKKLLASYLINVREKVFEYLHYLSDSNSKKEGVLEEIKYFCEHKLSIKFKNNYNSLNNKDKIEILIKKLNRPMRICGMVKNTGEPGGGPFWVKHTNGDVSLQVVESSQIDLNDTQQKDIFNNSTHFNPVDLVCCIKDFQGNKFNLKDFVDNSAGFISNKSKDGIDIKALELPGLWNGAMSDWITLFVEVPLITFNPVKTINDLLRKEHC